MMRKGFFILAVGCLSLLIVTSSGYGKVQLAPVTDPEIIPFPIAIADFISPRRVNSDIGRNIQNVVCRDLTLSGLFRVIEPRDFPSKVVIGGGLLDIKEEIPESDFDPWNGSGVDALLTGSFWISGNSLSGDFRLYDLVGKRFKKGIHYEGKTEEWRNIAHRIANEVVFQITGERGIFTTKIAFVSNRTGNKEIYLIDFDGENLSQVTHNKSINILPSWTTDGEKLLYTSYMKRNPDLYAIDLSSNRNYRISYRPGLNASPSWLSDSDGEKMVLMLKENDRSQLFLTKLGKTNYIQLTRELANHASPSWSPDGKQIAFVSDRSGTPQIYIMDAKGKNIKRLTYQGGYNVSPAWSPKGDWIAYSGRQSGSFEIFLLAPDGSQLRQLTSGSGDNEDPSWSPDGRYLAFCSSRDGGSSIYIMNVNGAHQRRLTIFHGEAMNPAWSPYLE